MILQAVLPAKKFFKKFNSYLDNRKYECYYVHERKS